MLRRFWEAAPGVSRPGAGTGARKARRSAECGLEPRTERIAPRPASPVQRPSGDDASGSRKRGRRQGRRREREQELERPQPAHFTPAVPPPAALANHSPGAAAGSLWSPRRSRVPRGAAGQEAPPEAAGARAAPGNPGAKSRLLTRLTEAGSGRPRGSAG